jgi:uncharacterized membrane protein
VGGESCFEIAKNHVRKLLRTLDLDGGDSASLVTLSRNPRLLSNRLNRLPDHLARLDELAAPSFDEADLGQTLRFLRDEVLPRIPGAKDVFILSDLQRRTFLPPATATEGEGTAYASLLKALVDQESRVVLVDVAGQLGKVDNLTAEDLGVLEKTVLRNSPATLSAKIANHGTSDRTNASATFVVDGAPQRTQTFTVARGATSSVEITHIFPSRGFHQVEVRLEEDDLEVDNSRYLAVSVRDRIPVLLVDGNPDEDPYLSEAGIAAAMLNPVLSEVTEGGTPFKTTTVSFHQFNSGRENLRDYDLVVLANVPEIADAMASALDNYVRSGHGLMIFLGDRVNGPSYNARLWREQGDSILPFKLDAPRTADRAHAFYQLQVKNFDHPVLETFRDPEFKILLLTPPILGFYGMEEVDKEGTTVVARINDSPDRPSPAIVERTLGEGRVLIFATSANPSWNKLADVPNAFLPLVQDAAYHLTERDLTRYNLRIGDKLRASTPTISRQTVVTHPGGRRETINTNTDQRNLGLYQLDLERVTLDRPGFYGLEVVMAAAGAGADEERLNETFAVNVNPAEGDLARISDEDLARVYGALITRVVNDVGDLTVTKRQESRGELAQALLFLLVLLTTADLIMAWKFGRRA